MVKSNNLRSRRGLPAHLSEKGRGGFTLIEILVVIGIIAILAAIVLVAINPRKQFDDANDTQRSANVNAVLNAVGQFMVDNNGTLPGSITTTAEDISSTEESLCSLVPTYIPALPVDPTNGTDPNNDGQIDNTECTAGTWNTGYQIVEDGSGRVTVSATASDGGIISVTR